MNDFVTGIWSDRDESDFEALFDYLTYAEVSGVDEEGYQEQFVSFLYSSTSLDDVSYIMSSYGIEDTDFLDIINTERISFAELDDIATTLLSSTIDDLIATLSDLSSAEFKFYISYQTELDRESEDFVADLESIESWAAFRDYIIVDTAVDFDTTLSYLNQQCVSYESMKNYLANLDASVSDAAEIWNMSGPDIKDGITYETIDEEYYCWALLDITNILYVDEIALIVQEYELDIYGLVDLFNYADYTYVEVTAFVENTLGST
jgi:hypothetical protein